MVIPDTFCTEMVAFRMTQSHFLNYDVNVKCVFDAFITSRYVLKNLKPGQAVILTDYKMKLEFGMHSREIQRNWYGRNGISLHVFHVTAQVSDSERHIEVLDLWSEDTKQDAWFTQSALDIGFAWIEKVFPNFQMYFLSG